MNAGAPIQRGVTCLDVWRQEGFHTTREWVSVSLNVHGYAAAVPMGSERDLSGQSAEATPCGEAQVKYPCLACNAVRNSLPHVTAWTEVSRFGC